MDRSNKIVTMILVGVLSVFILTSCNANKDTYSEDESKNVADSSQSKVIENDKINENMDGVWNESAQDNDISEAEECITNVIRAKNEDTIKEALTSDSLEYASDLLKYYNELDDFDLDMKKAGTYDGYDLFNYTILERNTKKEETGIVILKKQGDNYKICMNEEIHQRIYDAVICTKCKGAGTISSGGMVCSICSGVGQQYIANAYFDSVLQMWQGTYQVCSGCAGAGHIGMTAKLCYHCSGAGMVFD